MCTPPSAPCASPLSDAWPPRRTGALGPGDSTRRPGPRRSGPACGSTSAAHEEHAQVCDLRSGPSRSRCTTPPVLSRIRSRNSSCTARKKASTSSTGTTTDRPSSADSRSRASPTCCAATWVDNTSTSTTRRVRTGSAAGAHASSPDSGRPSDPRGSTWSPASRGLSPIESEPDPHLGRSRPARDDNARFQKLNSAR